MRKIYSLLIVLVLLISISSIVYADESEEDPQVDIENKTKKEIEVMNNSLGAEIRLLQLEKALLKNILKGEMAVQVLIGLGFNTTENNTDELESILAKMKLLLEDSQSSKYKF